MFSVAKQKLEDRLAAAAREKLAQASKESKEKQLQAERKRKAALFLQTLKNPLPETEVGKLEESAFSVEVCRKSPDSVLGFVVDESWLCPALPMEPHALSQMAAA